MGEITVDIKGATDVYLLKLIRDQETSTPSAQRVVVDELLERAKWLELIKAEQQFTGFDQLYKGGDIVSLVAGMGLGVEEWEQLKVNMPWLSKKLVEQVDAHFLGKVNDG